MVDRFDPPRDRDWKPLPMRPDIAGEYVRYSDLAKAHAEIERLKKECAAAWDKCEERRLAQAKAEAERDEARAMLARADRAAPEGQPVTLTYTNWRGETAERTITPKRIWFGSTDWHPEPQWLLTAFDAEKQANRDFALKDFGQAPPPAAQDDACRKCGGAMLPGKAMGQTMTPGAPDDLGGEGQTMSVGGPGVMIDCLKCDACGWSVTSVAQTMAYARELVERLKVVARCGTDSTMRHSAYAFIAQDPEGDYVTYSAYAALSERCMVLEEALLTIRDALISRPASGPGLIRDGV